MRRRTVICVASAACFLAAGTGAPTAPADPANPAVAGKTVFLDPGHSGANDASIGRQVPNGRGGTKPCQTSGTAADDGYPEHSLTWDVTNRIRAALDQLGVHTELSRADDTSVGPCIDARAAAANAAHPDAIVSIHADGGPASGRGFHVNYSSPALNDAQSGPAVALADDIRDSLTAAGIPQSSYLGADGLYGRADLAGLNLAEYPAVLVELGNMRNAQDAALLESADGRAQYAAAVTSGIVTYLSR
ncbi:Rv3717 family N-acetylmuramoyl-L-alanine amidase [Mycolicibacter icosiumassiliensis]|uniref:Rv3717 family N-acetylmuramoyl-L-alanine amidase n=1 Tax=Mycolicibacter icosiumassiliensis TaxID=1792835 RepID=UPI00082E3A7D|nr:Rv3717 family N-acetylmuramoyl-L-alanine amidase [Mycolicibacter icosiumassiliensis]